MSTEDAPAPVAPVLAGDAPHLLVVRAPYYQEIVDGMTAGVREILAQAGATYEILDVAGAFELPQVIRIALRGRTRYDGFVALGCVVRGETDHYDHICRVSMQGLMDVALQFGIALGTALLTVDTIGQAEARSGRGNLNKGAEAAVAALKQIAASRQLGAA
ncbi:MAG TPA: 6,7-dimethyl-8-ribityllumazine synthase [Bryobacteraceae bacterium]